MLKDKNKSKLLIIMIAIFLITLIIAYAISNNNSKDFNNIKKDKSKYLVYTGYNKANTTNYKVSVPYVNINSEIAEAINEDITKFADPFVRSKKSAVNYEYDVNGIILSLVVKAVDYGTEYAPKVYFRTYNFNLDTLELLDNSVLLDYYGVTEQDVELKIENQFKTFYQEELQQKYFAPNECNYECFLNYRNITSYLSDINYYVKEGKLIVYKPFVFFSIFGEEDFFKDKDFIFLIAEEPIK